MNLYLRLIVLKCSGVYFLELNYFKERDMFALIVGRGRGNGLRK